MKKYIVVLVVFFLPSGIFGWEEARSKVLQQEGQVLLKKEKTYRDALNDIRIRLIEIKAILGELKGKNVKEEVAKDERTRGQDTQD